jgi:hypothetical protein
MKGFGFLIICALATEPPSAVVPPTKKPSVQERRVEILRTMQDLRAKLQSLELELQLLEEERQNAPVEATPANPAAAWRETVRPDGRKDEEQVKKARARCSAFTSNGKRCTRSAEAGSKYCWQHRH